MEDVQYMAKQAVEESYLLLVDSAQRDKNHDKHPNQYDVVFTTPFRNVVGVDIITASIPRTQYVVENNNNVFAYKLDTDTSWTLVTLPVGDYPVTTLVNALNTQFAATNSPLQIQALSQPATLRNKLQLYSTAPFSLNMSLSSMRRVLGFTEPPTVEVASSGAYDIPPGYIDTDPDVFLSNQSATTGVGQTPAFAGPQASDGNDQIGLTSSRFVRERFTCVADGAVTTVALYANINGTLPSSDNKLNFVITDMTGLEYASGTVPVPNPVQPGLPAYLSDAINSQLSLTSGSVYYIIFYDADIAGDGQENCYTLYATQLITSNNKNAISQGTAASYGEVSSWTPYVEEDYDMCMGVQVTPPMFQVTSPGLYDLTGERYINIRCKQIEDHMFGARAYEKHNVGMAKIDLGVFGYSDSRFDFSSLPPRRFHPMSKLNRMTFTFERPDGSLYDFKGVDHTMVVSIRYMVADRSKIGLENVRVLNPSYDPNLQDYMAHNLLNYHDDEDVD